MKKLILATMLFFFVISAYSYDMIVGTNTFHYVFEDQTLSTQMQNRILNDLEIMQTPWTNREYVVHSTSNQVGYIFFPQTIFFPCFSNDKYLDFFPVITNHLGSHEIVISRNLSNDYKNAISFIDSHQDAWNERTNFLAHFTINAITNTPPGGFKEFIYGINISDEEHIRTHNGIAQHLLSMNYHQPNMLGMATRPAGFLNYPEEALWLVLPVSDADLAQVTFDIFYCVWRNGHWYYWSMAWID